jgi:hypothetical protein
VVPPAPVAVKPKAKPLTRAQKLKAALKACRRDRTKRAKCERAAHKRYAAKTKAKKAKRASNDRRAER